MSGILGLFCKVVHNSKLIMIKKKRSNKKGNKNSETTENQTICLDECWNKIYKRGLKPFFVRIDQLIEGSYSGLCARSHCTSGDSYMTTYDAIFIMCIQRDPYNYSQQLYKKLIEIFDDHFKNNIAADLKKCQQEGDLMSFLKEWNDAWTKSKCAIDGSHRWFMYLDRIHVPNNENLLNTSTVGCMSNHLQMMQKIVF